MKKINKIFGVGLVVVLLVSLLSFAAPVAASDQAWSAESLPGATGKLVLLDSDITDIAVAADGLTIYAINNQGAGAGYKSTDGGNTWAAITLNSGNTNPVGIAVAPDDADVVAIIDSGTDAVYSSVNGGTSFQALGVPEESGDGAATVLTDVAISPADAGIHYIAVSGYETADAGEANVWYFNLEGTPDLWKETITSATDGLADEAADTVAAVAFSPNFPSDKVMVAVTANTTGSTDVVRLEYFTFSATKKWGTLGNLPAAVTIETDDGISGIDKADLVLSPDFLGQDTSTYLSFIGLDIAGNSDANDQSGLFRVTSSLKALKQTATAGTEIDIQSVDYDGTNLVAGDANSNQVYRSANPTATTVTVSTATTNKRPGGTGETTATIVRFAGDTVVAGTTGNMSAFSVSSDLGKTFTDVSLVDIDTASDDISSLALSDDGSVIYMALDDGVGVSIWRKASTWQRVLALDGEADLILGIAPEDANTIYVANEGDTDLWVSQDGGDTKWFSRAAPANIADIAVESADVIYVLAADDTVYKSVNTGFTFGTGKDGKIGDGHSITSIGTDNLLIGGLNGAVAYSTDGGASFTDMIYDAGTGDVVVTASGLATGDFVYAAGNVTGEDIYRWEFGYNTTAWTTINDLSANLSVQGLTLSGDTLYAVVDDDNTPTSWLYRSLNPSAATTYEWSTQESAGERFTAAPNNIWVTSGSTKVWAIDTAAAKVFSYTDTTVDTAPTLSTPAKGATTAINTASGAAYDVTFTWSRLSKATTYDLDIATDSAFTEKVVDLNGIGSSAGTVAIVVGPNAPSGQVFSFLPGTTYYWRVRVKDPVVSPWSEVRSLNVGSLAAMTPSILAPVNGSMAASQTPSFSWSPVAGATSYQFKLADNVLLSNAIVDVSVRTTGYGLTKTLEEGKTYFWSVKALAPVEGSWSALANFTVKVTPPPPPEPAPPVVIKEVPAPVINIPAPPPPPPDIIIPPAPPAPAPITPAYIWAIIIIGAVLVIAVIVLIVRTRRAV